MLYSEKTWSPHRIWYEGNMLLDVLGKLHHSLMRRKLLPWASQNRMETQFGGFKG